MKINTPLDFQTFNDGVINIYATDENGNRIETPYLTNIPFENRTVGAKRYFEAKQENIEVSNLIRIPLVPGLDSYDIIESGERFFEIKQQQTLTDTNPACYQLTLEKSVR